MAQSFAPSTRGSRQRRIGAHVPPLRPCLGASGQSSFRRAQTSPKRLVAQRCRSGAPNPHVFNASTLIASALVLALLLLAVLVTSSWASPTGADAGRGTATIEPGGRAALERTVEVVVQPGDSLWSIARRLAPNDDPRPLVHRLERSRPRPGALQVGERLFVAASDISR